MERFIPACAGNSYQNQRENQKRAVHPRLRGELLTIINSKLTLSGSSPLARGTLLKLRLITENERVLEMVRKAAKGPALYDLDEETFNAKRKEEQDALDAKEAKLQDLLKNL